MTSWHLDVEPAPALLVLPPAAVSLDEAHAAIELWEHYTGKVLDATQRLTVEVMMATAESGRWAAATTGREMARQNGKGDEIEVVELWGLVQRGEAILHTVHDAVLLATQAQQRLLSVLEKPDLRRLKKRELNGSGQQMIEMRNGGIIWYRTRTGGGGRGVDDVDRLVVDEAQHATEEHLAAVAPTLLANENPQMNAVGTSGLAGKSDWWWTIRLRALVENPGAFGYIGHTAERVRLDARGKVVQEPVDVSDRSLWPLANPAIARRPDIMEFLEEQLLRLGPESFAREHLGVWDPPPTDGDSELDVARWNELADEDTSAEGRPTRVAFAVEMSPDRKWCTIGLAGVRPDGHHHVQTIDSDRGSRWATARLVELAAEWNPVAVGVYAAGPAGSLIAGMKDAGLEVTTLSLGDLGKATGMVFDGLDECTIRHSNQPLLNVSVGSARTRTMGDTKVWDLRGATDIAPLQCVSVALYALATAPEPKPTHSGVMYL